MKPPQESILVRRCGFLKSGKMAAWISGWSAAFAVVCFSEGNLVGEIGCIVVSSINLWISMSKPNSSSTKSIPP